MSESPEESGMWVRFAGYNPTRWHRLIDHYGVALTYCGRHWRGNGETRHAVRIPDPPCRMCLKAESPNESPSRVLADYQSGVIERCQGRIAGLKQQLAASQAEAVALRDALRRAEQRELEALAELDESTAAVATLREALLHQLFDLHNHSSRPCPTCERSRKALGGVEIGCGKLAPSFNHTELQRALAAARAKGGAG